MRLQRYPDGGVAWTLFIWSRHPIGSMTWTHMLHISMERKGAWGEPRKWFHFHRSVRGGFYIRVGRLWASMARQSPVYPGTPK